MIIPLNVQKDLSKFLRVVPRRIWIMFSLIGLFFLASYVFGYFIPIYQKKFIDTSLSLQTVFNRSLYFLGAFYLLNFIFDIIVDYSSIILVTRYKNALWEYYYPKIIGLPSSTIFKSGVGYYYSYLSSDVERVTSLFSLTTFTFLFGFFRTIAIMVIIAKWNLEIFYSVLVVFVLLIFISLFYQKKVKGYWEKIQENGAHLSKEAIESISNNFTIKNFSLLENFKNYIMKIKIMNSKYTCKRSLFSTNVLSLTGIIQTSGFAFIMIYSINLIVKGLMEYGTFIAIISYYTMIFSPIDSFYDLIEMFTSTEISIKRLNSIDNEKDLSIEKYKDKTIPLSPLKSLHVSDIKFAYDTSEKEYNLNFKLNSKTKLGIVGLSGEGKSSLIKLICLDEKTKEGNIFYNKENIENLPSQLYYALMNVYSQQIDIFNKDLVYNLTLDKKIIKRNEKDEFLQYHKHNIHTLFDFLDTQLKSKLSDNKVISRINSRFQKETEYRDVFALIDVYNTSAPLTRKSRLDKNPYEDYLKYILTNRVYIEEVLANIKQNKSYVFQEDLEEVIDSLELSTLANRPFGDRGAFISGGEKQKITFGRFLLKNGYDFFILDEPFTNLDANTENIILDLAESKLKDQTGLIISHKFNILRRLADSFIVMDNGIIRETGTHQELVKNEGLYKALFDSFNNQRIES